MANRINGDFNQDTIEAFRAAYAAQLQTPEDQEIDEYTRLPTNVVANTSPWIQHTGLWKANPGNQANFVPNQVLLEPEPSEDLEDEELSEEEIENFLDELLGYEEEEEEGEEDFEDLELEEEVNELLNLLSTDDETFDEEEELSEDEIDELIDSLQQEIEEALES